MPTISIRDELYRKAQQRAAQLGFSSVDAYIAELLGREFNASSIVSRPPEPRMSADEFERFLDEEAPSGPSPTGTFSRAVLYEDHD